MSICSQLMKSKRICLTCILVGGSRLLTPLLFPHCYIIFLEVAPLHRTQHEHESALLLDFLLQTFLNKTVAHSLMPSSQDDVRESMDDAFEKRDGSSSTSVSFVGLVLGSKDL